MLGTGSQDKIRSEGMVERLLSEVNEVEYGEFLLIETHMPRNKNLAKKGKTSVAFVIVTILNKNTFFFVVIKFMMLIWSQVRETSSFKSVQPYTIRKVAFEKGKGALIVNDIRGHSVNEVSSCVKCFPQEMQWHVCLNSPPPSHLIVLMVQV